MTKSMFVWCPEGIGWTPVSGSKGYWSVKKQPQQRAKPKTLKRGKKNA